MTMTDPTIKLNAPDRVGKQVVSILMDRSLTPFDRANRATALVYPLLMADSGLTPDPYDLADRLFALVGAIPALPNEPMQLHVGTCDQCEHCVYKEEEA